MPLACPCRHPTEQQQPAALLVGPGRPQCPAPRPHTSDETATLRAMPAGTLAGRGATAAEGSVGPRGRPGRRPLAPKGATRGRHGSTSVSEERQLARACHTTTMTASNRRQENRGGGGGGAAYRRPRDGARERSSGRGAPPRRGLRSRDTRLCPPPRPAPSRSAAVTWAVPARPAHPFGTSACAEPP